MKRSGIGPAVHSDVDDDDAVPDDDRPRDDPAAAAVKHRRTEDDSSFPTSSAANAFISSMSFASGAFRSGFCGCDECSAPGGREVPAPIAAAIRAHRLRRPLRRRQDRRLVRRAGGVALWEWVLPLRAEPLLEFGASHRLVHVQRLPCLLQALGAAGVVGSQQEEESRPTLDWRQGDVVLVPGNDGRAVGYVHAAAATGASEDDSLYATLFICKIPSDILERPDDIVEAGGRSPPPWYDQVRRLCSKLLSQLPSETTAYKLNEADAAALKECLRLCQG